MDRPNYSNRSRSRVELTMIMPALERVDTPCKDVFEKSKKYRFSVPAATAAATAAASSSNNFTLRIRETKFIARFTNPEL